MTPPLPPVTVRVEVRLVHSTTLSSPADDSRLRHRSSEVKLACLICQLTGIRYTERETPRSARTKGKKPINTSFWTLAPPSLAVTVIAYNVLTDWDLDSRAQSSHPDFEV